MSPRGFYRLSPNGGAADGGIAGPHGYPADPGPDPAGRPTNPGEADDESDADGGIDAEGEIDAEDLEIEKKWLQLAGLDPDKFSFFFDKFYDRIFAYAFWQTGDEDQATDVAAETFLIAWEKRGLFRWQGYSFGAWLFQIARSVISHERRSARTHRETEFDAGRHGLVENRTPESELAAQTDGDLVNQCLGRLPAAQHEAIVLHHFVGLSVQQIAIVTQSPRGTVASHLRRGKIALRRCLEKHGTAHGLSEVAWRIIRQAAVDESEFSVIDGKSGDA